MTRAPELQDKAQLILVAADDGGLREALAFMLEIEGYAVNVVSNAKAALALSHLGDRVCLVVDDSSVSPALTVMGEVRAGKRFWPALVLTGRPSEALSVAAGVMGARLIEKPLAPAVFLAAVERALAG